MVKMNPLENVMAKSLVLIALATLVLAGSMVPASAEDRTLTLTNNTQKAVTGFFVTPVEGEASVVNMVSAEGLAAGEFLDITIPSAADACVFDLKITFADTTQEDRPSVDFCNTDGYIIE